MRFFRGLSSNLRPKLNQDLCCAHICCPPHTFQPLKHNAWHLFLPIPRATKLIQKQLNPNATNLWAVKIPCSTTNFSDRARSSRLFALMGSDSRSWPISCPVPRRRSTACRRTMMRVVSGSRYNMFASRQYNMFARTVPRTTPRIFTPQPRARRRTPAQSAPPAQRTGSRRGRTWTAGGQRCGGEGAGI